MSPSGSGHDSMPASEGPSFACHASVREELLHGRRERELDLEAAAIDLFQIIPCLICETPSSFERVDPDPVQPALPLRDAQTGGTGGDREGRFHFPGVEENDLDRGSLSYKELCSAANGGELKPSSSLKYLPKVSTTLRRRMSSVAV
jgi:hypothetical protein